MHGKSSKHMVHLICKAALHKLGIISCSCLVYNSVSQMLSNSTLRSRKRAMENPPQGQKSAKQTVITVWKCLC